MRKLSEIQNEDALDVLAQLLDPIAELSKDKEITAPNKNEKGEDVPKTELEMVEIAIRKHKRAVQGLNLSDVFSGSATESTGETEQK